MVGNTVADFGELLLCTTGVSSFRATQMVRSTEHSGYNTKESSREKLKN